MLSFLDVLLLAVLIACGILGYIYFKVEGILNKFHQEEMDRERVERDLKYHYYGRKCY